MAVGRVVLVSGILVLLFIPFLLWGTGLMTARSQAALRAQFVTDQHRTGSPSAKHLSAPKQNAVTPAPLQVAPVMADPAVGSPVGTIYIPKISLSMVVV